MTAAKNVGMWHRGSERGSEALHNAAWRRADLHQSNARRQREASGSIQSLNARFCVLFCLFAVDSVCFLPVIYDR